VSVPVWSLYWVSVLVLLLVAVYLDVCEACVQSMWPFLVEQTCQCCCRLPQALQSQSMEVKSLPWVDWTGGTEVWQTTGINHSDNASGTPQMGTWLILGVGSCQVQSNSELTCVDCTCPGRLSDIYLEYLSLHSRSWVFDNVIYLKFVKEHKRTSPNNTHWNKCTDGSSEHHLLFSASTLN